MGRLLLKLITGILHKKKFNLVKIRMTTVDQHKQKIWEDIKLGAISLSEILELKKSDDPCRNEAVDKTQTWISTLTPEQVRDLYNKEINTGNLGSTWEAKENRDISEIAKLQLKELHIKEQTEGILKLRERKPRKEKEVRKIKKIAPFQKIMNTRKRGYSAGRWETARKEDKFPKRYINEGIGGSREDNNSMRRKQSSDSLKRSRD